MSGNVAHKPLSLQPSTGGCGDGAQWSVGRLMETAELFRVLGDPQRMILLANLGGRDEAATVTEAASCCGVHISGVSRHLALLRRAGVVDAAKVGREVRYRLNHKELAAALRAVATWLEAGPGCCACSVPDPADEGEER